MPLFHEYTIKTSTPERGWGYLHVRVSFHVLTFFLRWTSMYVYSQRRHGVSSNQWLHSWALWKQAWALPLVSVSPSHQSGAEILSAAILHHITYKSWNSAQTKFRSLAIGSQSGTLDRSCMKLQIFRVNVFVSSWIVFSCFHEYQYVV